MWFEALGAWRHSESTQFFRRFVRRTVLALASEARFWLVLNEPDVYTLLGYAPKWLGGCPWPPQANSWKTYRLVRKRLVAAHRVAYQEIKELCPDALVSSAVNLCHLEKTPGWWRLLTRLVFTLMRRQMWSFHEQTWDCQDFVALNYYMHQVVLGGRPFGGNRFEQQSDMGWELFPEGIFHILMQLANRYGKPVYITEHGLADRADVLRGWYLRESLRWVLRAIAKGADVRGYFHWSLMDNFEWDKGFWPRFGLLEIDRTTLERRIRASACEYAKIIQANALVEP